LGRWSARGDRDRIVSGHVLLKDLIQGNFVLTPSGMVRRECYDKISFFSLNMPWAGDWYLWCLFALYYDIGYFVEPMLCYREHHALSMTTKLNRESIEACAAEEISIPWIIWRKAQEAGYFGLAKECLSGIAQTYARVIANERYRDSSIMDFDLLEDSLRQNTGSESERNWLRTRIYASVGNEYYWQGDLASAKQFYQMALKKNPWMVTVQIKWLLLFLGKRGDYLRKSILSSR
jgi:hypothetical protein